MRLVETPATVVLAVVVMAGMPASAQTDESPEFGYEAYTDAEGHGESYWVARMGEARSRVRQLESEVERLDTAVGGLRFQWTSIDDPNQQLLIKDAWDDAIVRGERAREELQKAREAIQAAESEARRAGALPGWLRQSAEETDTGRDEVLDAVTYRMDLEELADHNARSDHEIYGEPEEGQAGETHADE